MKDTYISYFPQTRVTKPTENVNLYTICTTDKYRQVIELLRSYSKGSKEQIEIKNALPCFTPSIKCKERNKQAIEYHSGFLSLDFDNVAEPEALKHTLSQLNFITFASLSCSGRGCFALVKIKLPDLHKQYFDALADFFAQMGIELDKNGSDITRCRYVSYDPNFYYNENAEIWSEILPIKPICHLAQECHTINENFIYALRNYVLATNIDITRGRNNWLVIASFIAQTLGSAGCSVFCEISQFHPKYNQTECEKTFKDASTYERTINVGAVANIANRNGCPTMKEILSK